MTAATYTSNLTDIFLWQTTTGVSAYGGGGAGLGTGADFAMEGTLAVDKQITAADKGMLFAAAGAFTPNAYDHFYHWIFCATPGLADSRDNHGVHVSIGDDTSNFVKFHVDGNDTLPLGGGKVHALRFNNAALTNFRTLVGTPGTTPDNIGGGLNTTASVKGANLGNDGSRIGHSYTILNGTGADPEANFAGIASDDEGTSEGILQTANGGFNLQGKLRVGNSGTECEFLDSNTNIFILNTLHALDDLTEILIARAGSNSILTLTNVSLTALAGKQQVIAGLSPNRGRFEMLTPIIDAQDETSYDNSPTTEGTFSGGTGHAVSDILTMSDDSLITVDAVSGGVVTQFTVDSTAAAAEARSSISGTANTQVSSDGSGVSFSMTPDTDNLRTTPTVTATGVGFIGTGETVLDSGATMTSCRWIGAHQVTANGATLTDSVIESFDDQLIIDAQDETSYDGSPATEGSFVGGASHAASDVLIMSDGSSITVDAVSSGAVTEFTVDSSAAVASTTGVANTQLSTDGSGTGFTLTPLIDNLAEIAALKWEDNLDPDGELNGLVVTKGTNPTHAIEFGTASPLTMTLRDWISTGYDSADDGKAATFWVRRTSGTVTINVVGGSGNFSYKSDGATVVVVVDPVTTLINVKDNDAANLENARVYLRASDGTGDLPFNAAVTSITRSGAVATVTTTAVHGLATNNLVKIEGITDKTEDNNGTHQITVTSTTVFTYATTDSGSVSYTGTIVCTGVIFNTLTNASGNVSDTRTFSADQPVTGQVRMSTNSPRFKTFPLSGVIDNVDGLPINIMLALDE